MDPLNAAIIIPVLDDCADLRRLLDRIAESPWQAQQLIVVAGREDAELEQLCRQRNCTLHITQANRGAQLDQGAELSRAELLWFLHADAWPPADGLQAIARAVRNGAESGCFRFEFQGRSAWHKRLLARLVALRIALGGIPYGDQGLFVRRDAYWECGGFPHQPLFEEVRLVKRLRQRGTFQVLQHPLEVSTRRWDRDGWWSRTLHNRWLAACYMLGMPVERLARAYRKAPTLESAHEHNDR